MSLLFSGCSKEVTVDTAGLDRITSDGAAIGQTKEDYTATLTAEEGYDLPKAVEVTIDGVVLTGGYTYDPETGLLTIDGESITGNVVISAAAKRNFDAFIQQEFIDTIASDYTAYHIFVENPEVYGIDSADVEVNLGSRPTEDMAEGIAMNQVLYDEFKTFNRDELTPEQQIMYDIYEYQIEFAMKSYAEKFQYHGQMFSSMGGIHYQLATMFADWNLRDEQDVKDVILLLQDIKPYMESTVEYTKIQEEKGLLMIDIDSVIEYCEGILEKGEDSTVLSSLNAAVDKLELEKTKADEYKAQIKTAFKESFIPAYEMMVELMKELEKNGKNNEKGLAHMTDGKEYYELVLQQAVGSTKTAEEIRTMMDEAATNHFNNLISLAQSGDKGVINVLSGIYPTTDFESYEEILQYVEERMFEDFPEVKNLEYEIKDINEEIASSSGVAAYFNIPALDATTPKQLRVNPFGADVSTVDTYGTVAHEGFPGHMYQYAYAYENLPYDYQKIFAGNDAFTEGYAVYAQYEAFRYLPSTDQRALRAVKEYEMYIYCLLIGMDIGIHYDGWSLEEFADYCNEVGLVMDDPEPQYKQLQANPAAFQSYYVGYHEIAALRQKAEVALGKAFVDKEFNEALLKSGAAPFCVIENVINDYIAEVKAK
ncbi:MAG: DUF885 domain-containing protein [Firmicutes bacterium]|nr:DUF885 domain-containing protein [Bacillota bacterium]